MKKFYPTILAIILITSYSFMGCGDTEGDEPTPADTTDTTDNTPGGIQEVNIVIFGSDTVKMHGITCNPNTFGKPRLGFSGKSEDKTISANVQLRGTDPANGDKFTVDPDLDNGTSNAKFYYDSKNWTCTLDAGNTVTHLSDDTRRNVFGSGMEIVNDKDDQEKMIVSFNLTCTKP